MSKIIVFAVLFALAISMTITQEASALTKGSGFFNHSTASQDPSKVCGHKICEPGQNSKWSHAVRTSQRDGPWKVTGAHQGTVIMHQLVVNSLAKTIYVDLPISTSNANVTRSR